MDFKKNKEYFIGVSDVVLSSEPNKKSKAKNHLLLGDWLTYTGEEKNSWVQVRCRGDIGWLPKTAITDKRALEVNFIDVGQGDGCHIVTPDDKVILIDAGEGDNMSRFLNWRYNLRRRAVKGVEGVKPNARGAKQPFEIDSVVLSHPDKDHYYGFKKVFENKKLKVKNVYHNGIVERTIKEKDKGLKYFSGDDIGGYVKDGRNYYLVDIVKTKTAMLDLLRQNRGTRKLYLKTLQEAVNNNPDVNFQALCKRDGYFGNYNKNAKLAIAILGPIKTPVKYKNKMQDTLIKLGSEGVTKNGHSVIFQLKIGNLKIMLGGDLNTESQDFLLQQYCGLDKSVMDMEARLHKLHGKGQKLTVEEAQELAEIETELEAIVIKARKYFQVDITKACHHGSHHFSETFLKVLNAIVSVVSSGDNESYAHPRPDALGAYGKYGRGFRPLIFSTELARSVTGFEHLFEYKELLNRYKQKIQNATSEDYKELWKKSMELQIDKSVVIYGMITLRTDGDKVILAQKLEKPSGEHKKWDIHELAYNPYTECFAYKLRTGH